MRGLFGTFLLLAYNTLVVLGLGDVDNSGSALRKRHFGKRVVAEDLVVPSVEILGKRQGQRFSYYEAGMGACGVMNTDSDFIVALNTESWDGGSHCGQVITIQYGVKTVQATIMDECMGCGYGGLDFTPGLFSALASLDAGLIYGSWNYGGSPASTPTPTPTPSPSPTPTPSPSPTPTPTTSSSSISLATTSTASSSASTSSASATSTGAPTPSAATGTAENGAGALSDWQLAMIGISRVIVPS